MTSHPSSQSLWSDPNRSDLPSLPASYPLLQLHRTNCHSLLHIHTHTHTRTHTPLGAQGLHTAVPSVSNSLPFDHAYSASKTKSSVLCATSPLGPHCTPFMPLAAHQSHCVINSLAVSSWVPQGQELVWLLLLVSAEKSGTRSSTTNTFEPTVFHRDKKVQSVCRTLTLNMPSNMR